MGSFFYELLLSVIKWASEKGCIAVDYQFSGKIFQELLIKSEFKVQSKEYSLLMNALFSRFISTFNTKKFTLLMWHGKISK